MALSFIKDDNQVSLHDAGGLRPLCGANAFLYLTMTSGVQTATMPASQAAGAGVGSRSVVRVSTLAQPGFIAFGAAAATFTGGTDMVLIPANTVSTFAVNSTDTTVYYLQAGTAGTIQIAILS